MLVMVGDGWRWLAMVVVIVVGRLPWLWAWTGTAPVWGSAIRPMKKKRKKKMLYSRAHHRFSDWYVVYVGSCEGGALLAIMSIIGPRKTNNYLSREITAECTQ